MSAIRFVSTLIASLIPQRAERRSSFAGSGATVLAAALLGLLPALAVLPAQAQPHFKDCAMRTGASATLVIPASAVLTLDEVALQPGDEIAVFTATGRCAGYTVWRGHTAALTAWGDDAMTREVEGYQAQDVVQFRLWDASEKTEYHSENAQIDVALRTGRPYARTDLAFISDGIYVLDHLAFMPIRQAKR